MSQVQSGIPDTDVSRPSALPSANLQRTGVQVVQQSIAAQNSTEYLDAIEEEWNKKVDTEVDILVDGMVDLVSLASVSYFFVAVPIQFSCEYQCHTRSERRINFGLLKKH